MHLQMFWWERYSPGDRSSFTLQANTDFCHYAYNDVPIVLKCSVSFFNHLRLFPKPKAKDYSGEGGGSLIRGKENWLMARANLAILVKLPGRELKLADYAQ